MAKLTDTHNLAVVQLVLRQSKDGHLYWCKDENGLKEVKEVGGVLTIDVECFPIGSKITVHKPIEPDDSCIDDV